MNVVRARPTQWLGIILGISAIALATGVANERQLAAEEQAVELTSFAAAAQPSHDTATDLVLDRSSTTRAGERRLVGWALATDRVEVLADGRPIGTIPITVERADVALAHGAENAFVGFDGRLDVPADTFIVCVVRPGQLPGPRACDRPVLDLPRDRVVAFYGVPGAPALGTLGDGGPKAVRKRLMKQARPYKTDERPVVPAFELIATVAQASPGRDGDYSAPVPVEDLWRYLEEIRKVNGIVVLDLQTGRDSYMEQLPDLEALLVEPDVHLALDPEWHMAPGEVPNEVVGQTSAAEINEVAAYLDELVRQHRLPRKLLVVHNFQPRMITERKQLAPPATVDLLIHMDGHGPPATKIGNFNRLVDLQDAATGFKLFYQRDVPLMSPADVFAMDPDVDFISYQ